MAISRGEKNLETGILITKKMSRLTFAKEVFYLLSIIILASIGAVQTNPYSLVESISKTQVMSVACYCCIMGKQL